MDYLHSSLSYKNGFAVIAALRSKHTQKGSSEKYNK